jgi:uncharacterized membrane protein
MGRGPLAEPVVAEAPAPAGRRRPWGPEHVFAPLLAGFGLLFAFGIPPGQGADEPSHFPRAYHVSEGHLFPVMQNNWEWGGGNLPASVQRVVNAFFQVGNRPDLQVDLKQYKRLRRTPLAPEERLAIIYPTAAHYTFVPYLPSAAAIAVARAAGLGPLGLFYAGRLANLALGVFALFWAVRLCPVGKLVLGMTALIPIAVQQFATFSPDASTLSAAFLLIAVLLRLALQAGPPVGGRTVALLLGLTVWLALCKVPYVLLLLLYLGVPAARLGGRWRYLGVAGGLAVAVLCCLPLIDNGRSYVPNRMNGNPEVSIDRQKQEIRDDPGRYALVVAATVAVHSQMWVDQLGCFGWLDTPMNPLALHLYLLVLLVVALAAPAEGPPPPLRVKALALATCGVCFVVIVTACFVCGCPPGSELVYGPQGRYFLPLLPLLLLALPHRVIRVQADPRVLLSLAAASGAALLLVAVAAFVRRYYVPNKLELRVAPAALAAAAVLLATAVAWARWRWGDAAEGGPAC